MKRAHVPIFLAGILCLFQGVQFGQETKAQESGTTIRTTAQEVALDLIVRDNKGKIVKTLKAEDVQILEDGAPQTIRSFRLVAGKEVLQPQGSGKKEKGAAKAVVATPAAPATSSITTPLPALNLICIVFHSVGLDQRKWAYDAVEEFISSNLAPGTWMGAFNLGQNAQLAVLAPFTTAKRDFIAALRGGPTVQNVAFVRAADEVLSAAPNKITITQSVSGNPAAGGSVNVSMTVTGGEVPTSAIANANVSTGTGANAIRGNDADLDRQFGMITGNQHLDQVNGMLKQLATLPGRKSVLFISQGMATTGDPDQFQAMLDRANKAGVSVYALDTNGLSDNSSALASNNALGQAAAVSRTQAQTTQASTTGAGGMGVDNIIGGAGVAAARSRQGDLQMEAVRTSGTQAALRQLAESTGGFYIGSTNDLKKPFQRIVEDVGTHYEAVYHPSAGPFDGRLRTIEVKLAHPGWTVESRTGYFALPDLRDGPWTPTSAELAGLGALSVQPAPHAFDVQAAAVPFRPTAPNSQWALAFEWPVDRMTTMPLGETHRHQLHATLLALIKDAHGNVVDKFSQDAPFEIPEANLAAVRGSSFSFTHPIELPPGHYSVDFVTLDRVGNRASVQKLEFENPEGKSMGVSGIVLVQRVEKVDGPMQAADPFETQGVRITPELNTALPEGSQPHVYFQVYPDKTSADKPSMLVELLVNGQLAGRQNVDLSSQATADAIPMNLPAPVKAGRCELRITVRQGSQVAQRSIKYSVGARG